MSSRVCPSIHMLLFLLPSPARTVGSLHWWDFCVCDNLATTQVVTFQIQVMVLVEASHGNHVSEETGKAERQWGQSYTKQRQAKEEMEEKEKPKVKLLKFWVSSWTCFIRPCCTMSKYVLRIQPWQVFTNQLNVFAIKQDIQCLHTQKMMNIVSYSTITI